MSKELDIFSDSETDIEYDVCTNSLNMIGTTYHVNYTYAEIVKRCHDNVLLDLVINTNEKTAFEIITSSVQTFYKFKILYNYLVEEIDLTRDNYALFKYAFINGNIDVVQFLLQNNYNVPECLDFAIKSFNLTECSMDEIPSLLNLLLEFGADVTTGDNHAICEISGTYDKDLVLFKLFQSHGADISARSNYPIINAATTGKPDLVWHLIKCGVDISMCSNHLLHKCSMYRDHKLVEYLLDSGAEVKTFLKKDMYNLFINADIETLKLLLDKGLVFKQSDIIFKRVNTKNNFTQKYNLLTKEYDTDPLTLFLILAKYLEQVSC